MRKYFVKREIEMRRELTTDLTDWADLCG